MENKILQLNLLKLKKCYSEMEICDKMYYESLNWVNVPFKYKGYSKFGCDCLGLIVGIIKNCFYDVDKVTIDRIISEYLSPKYGKNLDLILKNFDNIFLSEYLKLINRSDCVNGDIIFQQTKYSPIHFGLYVGENKVIHTNSDISKVVISQLF